MDHPLDHTRARTLRQSETDAERLLWHHFQNRQLQGFKFRRQQPVGRFTVDFFCPQAKLIVELDGGHHDEDAQVSADTERTRVLIQAGYRVMRFWNNEVQQNTEGVLLAIERQLATPLPQSERE